MGSAEYEMVGRFAVFAATVGLVALCVWGLFGHAKARAALEREKETFALWNGLREERVALRDENRRLRDDLEAARRGTPYRGEQPPLG